MNENTMMRIPGEVNPPMGFLFNNAAVPLPDDAATPDWRKGALWRDAYDRL
jgi:hypothetical protein